MIYSFLTLMIYFFILVLICSILFIVHYALNNSLTADELMGILIGFLFIIIVNLSEKNN